MKHFELKNFKATLFSSAEDSFSVTATLIEKNGHSFLFNSKFIQADGQKIVAYLKEKNLELDGIFIMHGDPDFTLVWNL